MRAFRKQLNCLIGCVTTLNKIPFLIDATNKIPEIGFKSQLKNKKFTN